MSTTYQSDPKHLLCHFMSIMHQNFMSNKYACFQINLPKLHTKFTIKYLPCHFMSMNNQSVPKYYSCHPMSMINQNSILPLF